MNINFEKVKEEFLKYIEKYDSSNTTISRKIGHSFRVMEISEEIAKNLKLSQDEIDIAKIIGLLHDLGKFEQIKKNNLRFNYATIDHGELGVKILKNNNYIKNYISDKSCYNIIFKAIGNHNKLNIENGLNEKELLFTQIIRDADKLDIFYEGVEMFWTKQDEIQNVNKSLLTQNIFEQFKLKTTIDRKLVQTSLDGVVNFISFVFDLNFGFSYKKLIENDYINKILNKFCFENIEVREKMMEVRNLIDEYIRVK